MSKFLKLVQENTPGDDTIEVLYKLKEILGLGSKIDTYSGKDLLIVPLGDGRTATLELTGISKAESEEADAIEDQEMRVDDEKVRQAKKVIDAAETITGVNDPRRRLTGIGNPKKNVEKAVGDMYNKVAKKVKEFANQF